MMDKTTQCPKCGEDLTPRCWDNYKCTSCGLDLAAVIGLIYPLATTLSTVRTAMQDAMQRTIVQRGTKKKPWEVKVREDLQKQVTNAKAVLSYVCDVLDG